MTTTPPPTPNLGGYTPESLMNEVTMRALAQIQIEARAQGTKLSTEVRTALRVGVQVGATHMFKIIGEIAKENAKS